jgi:hypothetical protein
VSGEEVLQETVSQIAPTPNELLEANINHLRFLESYTLDGKFDVLGVDILRALNYELIQLLNHVWLSERLTRASLAEPIVEPVIGEAS